MEWIVGGVIPLALLLAPRLRRVPGSLGIAACLTVVGVFAFRIELVVIGFVNPLTQYPPGNALGTYNPTTTSFQLIGRYSPTWVEYGIVLGLVAFFLALVTVGYHQLVGPSAPGATRQAAPSGTPATAGPAAEAPTATADAPPADDEH